MLQRAREGKVSAVRCCRGREKGKYQLLEAAEGERRESISCERLQRAREGRVSAVSGCRGLSSDGERIEQLRDDES